MDSDEDMLDASDSELVDDYYSDDYGAESEASDGEYFDNKLDDDLEDLISQRNQRFIVLNEADIQQRQEEDITSVAGTLSISKDSACILLRHYKWIISKVHDEWFANEEYVRKVVGLIDDNRIEIPKVRQLTCGICFECFDSNKMSSASCGHYYCVPCWRGYISAAIGDGPACLYLRCPELSCNIAIGQAMINKLATNEDKEKYAKYLYRSYIENNRKTKWCPAPGCEFAVEFLTGNLNYDVSCKCSFVFCWNCAEEAHRSVDCSTVTKWILKNSAESENMNWILANSKPCPRCKRPIEKNQGCMHMTCTPPCKFEFCWLCLGAWAEHGERTGGFYSCNRYEAAKKEGAYDEAERRREMAKNSLERYTHYYERWASNQTSRNKAIADLKSMKDEKLEKLSENIKVPETNLTFIIDAWQQIVECRRVLKWTYAYGYYLPENEHAKRQFFEYLQGEAESALERLHKCAEKDLQTYLNKESPFDAPLDDFPEFRIKLAGLTSVTKNYFENLVRALENGLEDVSSTPTGQSSRSNKNNNTTKGKNGKFNQSSSQDGSWCCERCTFVNLSSSDRCQMCGHSLSS